MPRVKNYIKIENDIILKPILKCTGSCQSCINKICLLI